MSRLVDINLAALEGRRPGELLLHPCGCSTGTHRWRVSPCLHCRDGYVTVDGSTTECLWCWLTCLHGHVIDGDGEAFRPCPLCRPHSLGEHLQRSTRDQTPGPRAANTDPRVNGTATDPDLDEHDDRKRQPFDATLHAADHFTALVVAWWTAARDLTDAIQTSRPDRAPDNPTNTTDSQWCAIHLRLGICEPFHRRKRIDGKDIEYCRWCYDFVNACNTDPPEVILRAKHEGRRITQPMITAALRAAAKPKGKKRRRAS